MTRPVLATNLATIPIVDTLAPQGYYGAGAHTAPVTLGSEWSDDDEGFRYYARATITAQAAYQPIMRLSATSGQIGTANPNMYNGVPDGIYCEGAETVRVAFWRRLFLYGAATNPRNQLAYRFIYANGTWHSATVQLNYEVTAVSGQWLWVDLTFPVPLGAQYVMWQYRTSIVSAANTAVGDTGDIADIFINTEGYTGPAFNGDSPNCEWTGERNRSTSVLLGEAPPEPVPPLTATIFVRGDMLADTAEHYLQDTPTALGGLSLTWGRETTVDQPDTSSLSFSVAERPGKRSIYDLLHVGYPVDVEVGVIDQTVPPGDPLDVAVDGEFATAINVRTRPATNSQVVAVAGRHFYVDPSTFSSIFVRTPRVAPDASVNDALLIPPAPFGTVSTAWDAIPTVVPGSTWEIDVSAYQAFNDVSYPQTLAQPCLFFDPFVNGSYQLIGTQAPLPASMSDPWPVTVTIPTPLPNRAWLGLAVWPRPRIPWQSVAPSTLAWQDLDPTLPIWVGTSLTVPGVDDIELWLFRVVTTGGAEVRRQYLAFQGRITDLSISAGTGTSSVWTATASDWTADMANDKIGQEPWQAQSTNARVRRIQLAASESFGMDVDTSLRQLGLTYMDVDSQGVMDLLTDIANSVDGVLWSMFSNARGFYLWLEDVANRAALGSLVWDYETQLVIIDYHGYIPRGAIELSACDIARDAPSWEQTVGDVITRVDATWQEQTLGDDGTIQPTERNVHVYDREAEQDYGIRAASITTQLTDSSDCINVATRMLLRSHDIRWRTQELVWDTGLRELTASDVRNAWQILDGSTRQGLPITLTDLPEWTPDYPSVNAFLEGGTYTYESGRWTLALNVSPSTSLGYAVQWNDLDPSWQWQQIDPSIEWFDLYGVGGPLARRAIDTPDIEKRWLA